MLAYFLTNALGNQSVGIDHDLARFRDAYSRRLSDLPHPKADPAIGEAMDILIQGIRRLPKANASSVSKLVERYSRALHPTTAADDFRPVDEYSSCDAAAYDAASIHFVSVRMGAATRTVAFDGLRRPIRLPAHFGWNVPWNPRPIRLPCGVWLLASTSIQAMGNRVGMRLEWLQPREHRMDTIAAFEHETTLEFSEPIVNNNRVAAKVVDNPKAIFVSAATPMPGRTVTWAVRSGRVRQVSAILEDKEFRAADSAIHRSWHAANPTPMQKRLRALWPKRQMANNWSALKSSGRTLWMLDNIVLEVRKGQVRIVDGVAHSKL